MSEKSPEMENFLNGLGIRLFGRDRNSSCCVCCGNTNVSRNDFRDNLSWKEFGISRMCQQCQNSVFDGDEDDDS